MAKLTPTKPTFFSSPEDFRRWLVTNHASAAELWVGFYKKGSGRPSIDWPQSVDEALSFGWIDGIRKSIDAEAYVIRFTPRRRGSVWSNVNIRRAKELMRAGRMQAAGLRALEERDEKKSGIYAFEQKQEVKLSPRELARLRANKTAWKFYSAQPPGYKRLTTWWILSAKRPETRDRRLQLLIDDSESGRRIRELSRPEKAK